MTPAATQRSFRLRNQRTGALLVEHLAVASKFWAKGWGLLGRSALGPGEGLYIAPCNSIHSFFMRFTFDAVFVDSDWRVVHLMPAMPPWRISPIVRGGRGVVELPAGIITESGTQVGDQLWEEGPV